MLRFEYVIAWRQANPVVVYRVDTRAGTLDVAEQVAQGTLDSVRRMFPATPPDGFQILDDNDEIVLRSWESAAGLWVSIFHGALNNPLTTNRRSL